jgi:hypothetical protein
MLDPFLLPTKRPTPTEYGVIAVPIFPNNSEHFTKG